MEQTGKDKPTKNGDEGLTRESKGRKLFKRREELPGSYAAESLR